MTGSTDFDFLNIWPIASWKYPRVLVGIPIERAISYAEKVFHRFLAIASQGSAFLEVPYGRIDLVRNLMVQRFLSSDFTHLLMLDVDHEHPVDIIQRFAKWAVLRPDAQVISGLNFRRKAPYDPVAGWFNGDKKRHIMYEWEHGLVPVDEVGGASLFVHRDVFLKIDPPWFFNIYDKVWENDWPGEDIGFCRKCRELDIPIHVDTDISSPHCTEELVTEETFRNHIAKSNARVYNV